MAWISTADGFVNLETARCRRAPKRPSRDPGGGARRKFCRTNELLRLWWLCTHPLRLPLCPIFPMYARVQKPAYKKNSVGFITPRAWGKCRTTLKHPHNGHGLITANRPKGESHDQR
jgi:hypothetical protein